MQYYLLRGCRQDISDAAHVATEGAQALLQALAVAKVSQHPVKPQQSLLLLLLPLTLLVLRTGRLWQEEPRLCHQALQAQRLERGSLAACTAGRKRAGYHVSGTAEAADGMRWAGQPRRPS